MSAILLTSTAILMCTQVNQVLVNGAPLDSTKLTPVNGSPLPGECVAADEYWNNVTGKCAVCIYCGRGHGSTANECGYGTGEKGKCDLCQDGETYQDQISTQGPCRRCIQCDVNATVLSNCTITQNTVCGPCNPGYGHHPGSSTLCSLCSNFNDDEKPVECLSENSSAPPTEPPTTSGNDGGSSLQFLPETTTTFEVTATPNGTTGTANLVGGSVGWPVGVAVTFVIVIVILVAIRVCLRRKHRRQTNGRQKGRTTTEPGTSEEGEALTNVGTETSITSKDAASPSSIEANGDVSSPVDTTLSSTELSHGPELLRIGGSAVAVDCNRNLPFPTQPSTKEDASATNGDISPRIISTIPEETSNNESVRQDSNKLQQMFENVASKTPRPKIMRTCSEPGDHTKSEMIQGTCSSKPPVLGPNAREGGIKSGKNIKEEEFEARLNKACSCGNGMEWNDLPPAVRKTIVQMLTPTPGNKIQSTYVDLGEALGLDRQKELRPCKDVNDVFEVLNAHTVIGVNMEEVLLKLKHIKRCDVLRVMIDGILDTPKRDSYC